MQLIVVINGHCRKKPINKVAEGNYSLGGNIHQTSTSRQRRDFEICSFMKDAPSHGAYLATTLNVIGRVLRTPEHERHFFEKKV